MGKAVEVSNLTVEINGVKVISDLSISVDEGELICVAGPTGSGKSTFLRVLTGIIPELYKRFKVCGRISIFGLKPIEALYRGLVAYVPQDVYSFFIGSTPREELAILGVEDLSSLSGIDLDRDIGSLSDGQLYRFLLFSALSSGSRLIAIDEPSSHVDRWSIEEVLAYIENFTRERRAAVFIADHRLDIVGRFCSKMICLGDFATASCDLPQIRGNPSARPIAKLDGVCVSRNGVPILNNVTLSISLGEPVAIVGRNGAGKTTLLKVLSGAVKASKGRVILDSGTRIFLVPQNPVYWFPSESVSEVMKFFAQRHGFKGSIEGILEMFYLHGERDKNVYALSVGEARMLSLALAYVSRANLILIDEPTLGLDCKSKRVLAKALNLLLEAGNAVVVATHDLDFASQFSSKYILDGGKLSDVELGETAGHGKPPQRA